MLIMSFTKILQLEVESEVNLSVLQSFLNKKAQKAAVSKIELLQTTGILPIQELTLEHPNGHSLTLMIQASKIIYQNEPSIQVVFYDITARKKMEVEKDIQNHYTKVLLELEALGSKVQTKSELVNGYCETLVEKIGFDCVWIADHKDGTPDPFFPGNKSANKDFIGLVDDHVQAFLNSKPYEKAVKTREMVVSTQDGKSKEKWQQVMREYNLQMFVVLPFIREGKIRGTFCLLSQELTAVDAFMKNFLSQMIYECGYGIYAIELKRNRDELNDFNKLLVDSLDVVSVSFDPTEDKLSLSGNTQTLAGCTMDEFADMVRNPGEYIHSNDLKKLKRRISEVKKKEGNFDVEFRVKTPDKKLVWLNAIGKIYWKKC